jgi:hypothetical protein
MPPARPRANLLALVAAGLLLLAGIIAGAALLDLGPFDDETLTERQFVTRADEVCGDAHDRFREAQRSRPQTAVQAQAETERLIATAEQELADLENLSEPASLSEPLSRYLAARDKGIELLRKGLEAARDNDGEAYATAQVELARGQLERLRLARQVGFSECSRPITSRTKLERDTRPLLRTG